MKSVALYTLFFMVLVSIGYAQEKEVMISKNDILAPADMFDQNMKESGILFSDTGAESYIKGVAEEISERIIPEKDFSIDLIYSSDQFGWILPNGSIYIAIGLFNSIRNEAQLALFLAHEMAHLYFNHHIKKRYSLIKTSAENTSLFWGTNVRNIKEAMGGFSKEHEREADSLSLTIVVELGDNPWEGSLIFENIREWKEDEGYDKIENRNPEYNTHPTLKERFESAQSFLKENRIERSGNVREDLYHKNLVKTRMNVSRLCFNSGEFKTALKTSLSLLKRYPRSIQVNLLNGYNYLGYKSKERLDSSVVFFRKALRLDSAEIDGIKGMGYAFYKMGVKDSASVYFNRYMDSSNKDKDAPFIKYYLREME